MTLFYNIIGTFVFILALLMLRCAKLAGEGQKEYKSACKLLHATYMLIAISMFAAQLEPESARGAFQLLNPFLLMLYFLAGQGLIYTVLILFGCKTRRRYIKYLKFALALFVLYTIAYLAFDDPAVYSFGQLSERLPHSPVLVLRCLFLLTLLSIIAYGVKLSHDACRAFNAKVARSFNPIDFQQSVVISKFMWSGKTIAVWPLLTYFWTTPTFEIISCSITSLLLALQLISFYELLQVRNSSVLRVLTISGEIDLEVNQKEIELQYKLKNWIDKAEKPYTQSGIAIAQVAIEIDVPKTRLSAYINSTGTTFPSWINNLRVEEAKVLLHTKKELSISEIADMTGFCDLPAFSHAFKRVTGIAPKTFRSNANA